MYIQKYIPCVADFLIGIVFRMGTIGMVVGTLVG